MVLQLKRTMDNIRFFEDHVRITILNNEERNGAAHNLIATGKFEEVVTAMNEICVKFDPLMINEKDIEKIIATQPTNRIIKSDIQQHHFLIDFNQSLDMDLICKAMDMDASALQQWFLHQKFQVDMMGFQPGFAYLSHDGDAPTLSRLHKPRAMVRAGSIGILGKTACIYAHNGPGGWPIIGRINIPIFDSTKNPPNLLQSGNMIEFKTL